MIILAIIACALIGAWTGLQVSRPYIEATAPHRGDACLGPYVSETETIFLIVGAAIGATAAGAITMMWA